MSRTTNARIAGFTFLFYIAVGIASLALYGRATAGDDVAAKLASIARHQTDIRLSLLFTILAGFSAIVLAVTLYSITRDQDRDLAMLAASCRIVEGVTGVVMPGAPGLLWLATNAAAGEHRDATETIAGFLFRMDAWAPGALFFAVGSTLFSWLLLRGRMIPLPLAWLGVLASALLVVVLPLDLTGLLGRPAPFAVWLPMLVFEVALALWFITKGAAAPVR